MKALKITFEHGRIWKADTSDGRSFSGASLQSVLDKVLLGKPEALEGVEQCDDGYDTIRGIFVGIQDSGGSGQIARGQASG